MGTSAIVIVKEDIQNGKLKHAIRPKITDDDAVKNVLLKLYIHYDGYESYTGKQLLDIVKKFNEVRGIGDKQYLSAWIVKELISGSKGYTFDGLGFGILHINDSVKYQDFIYIVQDNKVLVYNQDILICVHELVLHKRIGGDTYEWSVNLKSTDRV